MSRSRHWRKWDALQKKLDPLQKRYAKAAIKEAYAVFGKECFKPPTRMGVLMWVIPELATVLELARLECKKRKLETPDA
jgi:hypothetical protein